MASVECLSAAIRLLVAERQASDEPASDGLERQRQPCDAGVERHPRAPGDPDEDVAA